jgi:diguanylate cyclase (GGDEF)-like protein
VNLIALLPNTRAGEAPVFADRMRQLAEDASLSSTADGLPDIRCTVSIGVTTSTHGKLSGAELLREPDDALYKAKNGGCNRVVAHAAPSRAESA